MAGCIVRERHVFRRLGHEQPIAFAPALVDFEIERGAYQESLTLLHRLRGAIGLQAQKSVLDEVLGILPRASPVPQQALQLGTETQVLVHCLTMARPSRTGQWESARLG